MTLKQMFQKMENYNEVAEMMGAQKARICFSDNTLCVSMFERFSSYSDLRKYINREYFKNIADQILKSSDWEFDADWHCEGTSGIMTFNAELTAN